MSFEKYSMSFDEDSLHTGKRSPNPRGKTLDEIARFNDKNIILTTKFIYNVCARLI